MGWWFKSTRNRFLPFSMYDNIRLGACVIQLPSTFCLQLRDSIDMLCIKRGAGKSGIQEETSVGAIDFDQLLNFPQVSSIEPILCSFLLDEDGEGRDSVVQSQQWYAQLDLSVFGPHDHQSFVVDPEQAFSVSGVIVVKDLEVAGEPFVVLFEHFQDADVDELDAVALCEQVGELVEVLLDFLAQCSFELFVVDKEAVLLLQEVFDVPHEDLVYGVFYVFQFVDQQVERADRDQLLPVQLYLPHFDPAELFVDEEVVAFLVDPAPSQFELRLEVQRFFQEQPYLFGAQHLFSPFLEVPQDAADPEGLLRFLQLHLFYFHSQFADKLKNLLIVTDGNEFIFFEYEQPPIVDIANAVFASEFLDDVPDGAILLQDHFDVFLIDGEQLYADGDGFLQGRAVVAQQTAVEISHLGLQAEHALVEVDVGLIGLSQFVADLEEIGWTSVSVCWHNRVGGIFGRGKYFEIRISFRQSGSAIRFIDFRQNVEMLL